MSSDQPPPYSEKPTAPTEYPQSQPVGYPPQQGQYPPQQGTYQGGYAPQPQQVIAVQPTVTVGVQRFREFSVRTTCPHCQADVMTAVAKETGTFAWCMCCLIALFFLWPFCFIALCIDALKDWVHTCPNCHKEISRYKRM